MRTVKWVFAGLFTVAAAALTVVLVVVVFQALTGNFEGGEEVGVVRIVAAFLAFITAAVWAAAIGILRSAINHDTP